MKKTLLFIMLLCATCVSAQDVIVKKDGSTILSKVIEIGTSEVKYKKFSNQNGPTYSINKSEIQAINYANGEKEDFSKVTVPSYGQNNMQQDYDLTRKRLAAEDLYKEARTLKAWSWVCVILGAGGGITGLVLCEDETLQYVTLGAGIALCCGGGLMGLGQKKKKEAESLLSSTIIEYDIKLGDCRLSPSLNLLSEAHTCTPHLGIGVKLKF